MKSKMAAKKWLWWYCRLIAKNLITTIQENLCCLLPISLGFGTKFIWIAIIKIFTIDLPSQPFLGHHLGFHIFLQWPSWGHTFFYSLAVFFWLDFTSFCNCILQCWHISINGCCYLSFCFLHIGRYMQYSTYVSCIQRHCVYWATFNSLRMNYNWMTFI